MAEFHFWKRHEEPENVEPQEPTPAVEGGTTEKSQPQKVENVAGSETIVEHVRPISERINELKVEARKAPLAPEQRITAVLHIRGLLRAASDAKSLARAATEDRTARNRYAKEYAALKAKIVKLRESPEAAGIELAWREYLQAQVRHGEFKQLRQRERGLDRLIRERSLAAGVVAEGVTTGAKGKRETARLTAVARAMEATPPSDDAEIDAEIFRDLFGVDPNAVSAEGADFVAPGNLVETEEVLPREATIADLEVERVRLRAQRSELWKDPMVRYFHEERQRKHIREQLQEGREVVDLPSTERILTQIDRFELEEPSALFGAVIVGPPGTGKTTAVREHCRRLGRRLVEIDLSGDVTRYLFWGTREIVHEDPVAKYEQLTKRVADLHGEKLVEWLRRGVEDNGPTFLNIADEVTHELALINEATAAKFKEEIQQTLRGRYDEELAHEVYKYGRENGWRAGLVMHALKRGNSILFNEFNKATDLSFLHGLLTTHAASNAVAGTEPQQERPGWFHVADAKQWVRLPMETMPDGSERAASKMYFTANVGKQYKVASVLGPLASRAEGKVIEMNYVPKSEELLLMSTLIEDAAGKPILDVAQNEKVTWLVGEVLPKIRAFIADKPNAIPISFRTLRNLAAKLVDRETGRPRTGATVDRTAREVLIDTYALYPSKEIPRQIAVDLITTKVLTDNAIIVDLVRHEILTQTEVDAAKGTPISP